MQFIWFTKCSSDIQFDLQNMSQVNFQNAKRETCSQGQEYFTYRNSKCLFSQPWQPQKKMGGGGQRLIAPIALLATSLLFWVSYIESETSHQFAVRRNTALHASPQLRLRFPRSLVRIFDNFYVFTIFLGLIHAYVPPISLYQGKWTQSL